ncbi:MAG: glycosyltransferase family 4 protein [Nitrospirae bacterium]|nr:glycosyltransferase family 4 protein [Nitrospirota bacterium]
MTKRKLTILHTESSTGWAGQEMRIILEAREMKKLGHDIIIAAQPGSGIIPAIEREGFDKEILSMKKKDFITSIIQFVTIISKHNVDIVNTHSSWDSWIASIAARISSRKPIIIRTRHLSTPISKGLLSRIVYQYLPYLVITTGNSIRESLININRFPHDKIVSIPTGVDLDVFCPRPVNNELRSKFGISKEGKAIGTIAALRSWKGHDYLLEAAKILIEKRKDTKFIIAGDGPRYNHLLEKSKSMGITDYVLFLGHRDDIPAVMSILDVIVLPSYANEGVPQSILQAMAMGKPVVASSAGSIPEVVHDKETGILVEPKNANALAEGIVFMLDNYDFARTVAANARKLIETKYSLRHMVDEIEEVYNDLMQKYKT